MEDQWRSETESIPKYHYWNTIGTKYKLNNVHLLNLKVAAVKF
jgi:hypothetical protein